MSTRLGRVEYALLTVRSTLVLVRSHARMRTVVFLAYGMEDRADTLDLSS